MSLNMEMLRCHPTTGMLKCPQTLECSDVSDHGAAVQDPFDIPSSLDQAACSIGYFRKGVIHFPIPLGSLGVGACPFCIPQPHFLSMGCSSTMCFCPAAGINPEPFQHPCPPIFQGKGLSPMSPWQSHAWGALILGDPLHLPHPCRVEAQGCDSLPALAVSWHLVNFVFLLILEKELISWWKKSYF